MSASTNLFFGGIAAFARELPRTPEKISLLPFHKFAGGKYQALGKTYAFDDSKLISDSKIQEFKCLVESFGLATEISS